MNIKSFFGNAFRDMKESAMAQHEVDTAQLEAVKAKSRANFAEAKAMNCAESRKAKMQAERDGKIAEAKARTAEADARYRAAKE